MTLKKWVHDRLILGNDQPFCKGQKETPGMKITPSFSFEGGCTKFEKQKNSLPEWAPKTVTRRLISH